MENDNSTTPQPAESPKTEVTPTPVAPVSSTPKSFVIRCGKCRWAMITSGVSEDLKDIHEIKSGCVNCGKPRKFHCKKCGAPALMRRFKGNSDV